MNLFDDNETEINITPLVDVFLVLLSIFVALSILYFKENTYQEKINIPASKTVSKSKSKIKYQYIFIYKDLSIKIKNLKFKNIRMFKKYLKNKRINKKINFNIVADENIKYKYIIEIMDIFKDKQIKNINLELRKKNG